MLLLLNDVLRTECLGMSWTVATEWHLYLLSPLIMLAAWSPRRAAPRRHGLAGLAAASLVQPAIMAGLVASGADAGSWVRLLSCCCCRRRRQWTNGCLHAAAAAAAAASARKCPLPAPVPRQQGELAYTLPFTRCAPYLAGMWAAVCCAELRRAQQLPTAAAQPCARGSPAPAPAQAGLPASSSASSLPGKGGSAASASAGSLPSKSGDAGTPAAGDAPAATGLWSAANWECWLRLALDLEAVAGIAVLTFLGVGANM